MTEVPTNESPEPTAPKAKPLGLIVAAIALVAAPALLGYFMLRDDGAGTDTDMSGDAMAGGAAATSSSVPTGRDLVAIIGGDVASVRDLDEILAGNIEITFSPAGDTAEVKLTTTIEVACAVAYGTTADFGALATDTDMAGGGHTDHHPLLRDLKTDVQYIYRIHAIAGDGTLYVGDTMALLATGPNGSVAPERPGENLAGIAEVVEVSSEYSDAFAAANAIDGDGLTEWSSAGDGDDAYIVIDFGEDIHAVGVGFATRSMSDGTSITNTFTITVDGDRTYGPFTVGTGLSIAEVEFVGRRVRFDIDTSTGGNTGAVEIEVYGITVAEESEGM